MTTHGLINLHDGFCFAWLRTSDGEVCGHVEAPDRSIVKGSYGFYRTNDEQQAAKIAESNLNLKKGEQP